MAPVGGMAADVCSQVPACGMGIHSVKRVIIELKGLHA